MERCLDTLPLERSYRQEETEMKEGCSKNVLCPYQALLVSEVGVYYDELDVVLGGATVGLPIPCQVQVPQPHGAHSGTGRCSASV